MVESNEDQASWHVRLAQVRQELGVGRARNIAIAEFQIGGDTDELIAVSGQAARAGTVGLPQNPLFETFEVPPGHSRAFDSEYKLLEALASRYVQTPEVQGTVYLFTERPPCASCRNVIEQFRQQFPNIRLNVNYLDND
jgi:hypothetical protein